MFHFLIRFILVPPSLNINAKYKDVVKIKAGTATAFEIPLCGYPKPTVEWQFNNGNLPDLNRIKEDTIIGMTSLCIGKSVRSDSGTYTLTARNEHGEISADIQLIVMDKPGPPVDVTCNDVTATGCQVVWKIPNDDGGSPITGYAVEKKDTSRRVWQSLGETLQLNTESGTLTEGNTYVFRVASINKYGQSEWVETSPIVAKHPFDPPGKPNPPTVTDVTKETCNVHWVAPESDGGSPITGYWLEYQMEPTTRWVRVNRDALPASTLQQLMSNLVEDSVYRFRVAAENKAGQGPFSEPSEPVTMKDPWTKPGKPGKPDVSEIKDTSCKLTWEPPKSDGGAPITNYVVEMRKAGDLKWSPVSTFSDKPEFTVTGLKTGAEYEFRIRAENKAGQGDASDASDLVRIKEPVIGDPPRIIKPLPDLSTGILGKKLTLSCDIDRGKPIADIAVSKDGRDITMSRRVNVMFQDKLVEIAVSESTNTDAGNYKIEAKNALGSCETEGKVDIVELPKIEYDEKFKKPELKVKVGGPMLIPLTITGQPEPDVKLEAKNDRVKLRQPVITDRQHFDLAMEPTNRADYSGKYVVTAENCAGKDEAEFNIVVIDKPSVPRNLKVKTSGKEFITVQWDEPEDDGGCKITGYEVEKRDTARTAFTTAGNAGADERELSVKRLLEGNQYIIHVRAVNEVGQSEAAEIGPVTAKLPFDVPSPPRNPQVLDTSKTTAKLSWKVPESDGGSPIIGYHVEIRSGGIRWLRNNRGGPVKELQFDLSGLQPDAEYEYRIIAENAAGESLPSEIGTFIARPPMEDLRIVKPLPDIEIEEGDTAVLETQTNRPVIDQVKWDRNGIAVLFDGRIREEPSIDKKTFKVEITDAKLGDSGKYSIQIEDMKVSGNVKVVEEDIHFTKQVNNVTITELSKTVTAVFECELNKANKQTTWTKNGEPIIEGARVKSEVEGRVHRLTISDIKPEDVGKYKCAIKGKTSEGQLDLEVPPTLDIDEKFKVVKIKANTATVFEIPFKAWPIPDIKWQYEKGRLPDSSRMQDETIKGLSCLRIRKAQRTDSGIYSLTIANKFGSLTAEFQLIVLDKPSAPRDLRVSDIASGQCVLHWNEPSDDGGSPIIGYTIEKRDPVRHNWSYAAETSVSDRESRVTSLTDKQSYWFQVAAKNEIGTGEFAEIGPVDIKEQIDPPGKPEPPKAGETKSTSIKINYQPPVSDGGAPITGYHIERRISTSNRWMQITKIAVPGLQYEDKETIEDTTYIYRVAAENRAGLGPYSEPSEPITAKLPFGPPGKPRNLTIKEIGKNFAVLTWSEPSDDGGDAIFNYSVEYKMTDASRFIRANRSETVLSPMEFKVTGLEEGFEYVFQVSAENHAGNGPPAVTEPKQIKVKPSGEAPKLVSNLLDMVAKAGDKVMLDCEIRPGKPAAVLTWYKDGREIGENKHFISNYSESIASLKVLTSEIKDAGKYKCVAKNQFGQCETSATLTICTPPALEYDNKLQNEVRVQTGKNFTLPVLVTGSPNPEVTWFMNSDIYTPPLHCGSDYRDGMAKLQFNRIQPTDGGRYTIEAKNQAGQASADFTIKVVDKPSPPQHFRVVTTSKEHVDLVWEAPESDGGSPITSYVIERCDVRRGVWVRAGEVPAGSKLELKAKGLMEGTDYYFRISAENEVGPSEPTSLESSVTAKDPFDVPGPPRNVKASNATNSSCELAWDVPETDGGSPITGYIVEKREIGGNRWTKVNRQAVKQLKMTINDLFEGDTYEFRVFAENQAGLSRPSLSSNQIKIESKPTAKWLVPLSDVSIKVGEKAVFTCKLSTPMRGVSAKWNKDGLPLLSDDRLVFSDEGSQEFKLEINQATLFDQGQYSIQIGDLRSQARLQVAEEKLALLRPLQDQTVNKLPNEAVFECEFNKSNITVEWTVNARSAVGDKFTSESEGGIQRLKIACAPELSGAKVECSVRDLSTSAKLTIKDAPYFKTDESEFSKEVVIKAGSSKQFELNFAGTPAPKVTWLFEGQSMRGVGRRIRDDTTKTSTTLYISRSERQDTGKYTCKIENDHGKSTMNIKLLVIDKPSSPINLAAGEIFEDGAMIHWEPPKDDGGRPVTEYLVEYREAVKRNWMSAGRTSDLKMRLSNLIEGQNYYAQVSAINEVGQSEPAEMSQPFTPKSNAQVPGAPSKPDVDDISKSGCKLNWRAPTDDGGSPILSYVIEKRSGALWVRAAQVPSSNLETTLSDLMDGQQYEFRVAAVNKIGQGPFSEPSDQITAKDPYDVPGKVRDLRVGEIGKKKVQLRWKVPASDGGSPITDYLIEHKAKGLVRWTRANVGETVTDTNYTVTGLDEELEYEFQVAAANVVGAGPFSQTEPVFPKEKVKLEPPSIVRPLKETVVSLGSGGTMDCQVDLGSPSAEITWYRAGREIYAKTQGFSTSISGNTATLRILSTRETDFGEYTCELANAAGRCKTSAKLMQLSKDFTQLVLLPIFTFSLFFSSTCSRVRSSLQGETSVENRR